MGCRVAAGVSLAEAAVSTGVTNPGTQAMDRVLLLK